MNHEQIKKVFLETCPKSIDFIALKFIKNKAKYCSVKNSFPHSNSLVTDKGIQVEVLHGGQFSYAATHDISPHGIKSAIKRAILLNEQSLKWNLFPFSLRTRPNFEQGQKELLSKSLGKETTLGEINDVLSLACGVMKKETAIIHSEGHGSLRNIETYHITSNGDEDLNTRGLLDFSLKAIAQSNNDIQTRTWGNTLQLGSSFFQKELFKKEASRIAKEAIDLANAPECPSEAMDVILLPDQMILQIHESIGHPLELDRILGDERNYAGLSFIKKENFGQYQYGSPKLNITFDPTVETEAASYALDDTGVKASKEFIIKEGKLLRGLGSLESQERSRLKGVACSRMSSWNRPPIDRMANLNLEPGETSFESMVSNMKRGIIMATNKSWSIDDYRNKFQFGSEYAQLVEDGRPTKIVKNPNYRGITTPFWHKLKEVGNQKSREIFGTPYCGKGEPNQAIEVGHASPACLFENVEVFGGA